MSVTKRPFSWTEMGQLRPKQLKMKRGGVEGFQPTQEFYGTGTELDPIVIEEGVMDTIYILAPSSTGGSEFIPVPTMYPTSANVPVQLNNYFRFEEVEADTTAQAGEAEEAVVTSVVPSVSISVPAVQPPDVEPGYSTPTVNRYLTYTRRHYNQTRFGLDAFERPNGRSTAAGACGIRNPPSVLSRVQSHAILPQAEQETESEDDQSVELNSQDSTRSGESWEYRKDEPDDDDDIVYV
jgi:hypothetical protein